MSVFSVITRRMIILSPLKKKRSVRHTNDSDKVDNARGSLTTYLAISEG